MVPSGTAVPFWETLLYEANCCVQKDRSELREGQVLRQGGRFQALVFLWV